MRVSAKAIEKITVRTRNRLALEFDCSVVSVDRWIRENEPNGNLTKARAIEIISEETKLGADEILEDSDLKEVQSTP